MRGPKEKKERALGEHLHLKGERCSSPKCALVRRPYPPGAHGRGKRRKAPSDFARQLQEKQKFKISYGLNESNLSRMFKDIKKSGDASSMNLVRLLESRLDNVVFRLGFAKSRSMARKMVHDGHIVVNNRRVKSPGYVTEIGDSISIRKESRPNKSFEGLKEYWKTYEAPAWLAIDAEKDEGRIIGAPDESQIPFELSLLVESFSK